MASRRGIGTGLAAASNTVSSILDAYIKQALTEESQIRQNTLMAERQKELERLRHQNQMTEYGFQDPRRLAPLQLRMSEALTNIFSAPDEGQQPTIEQFQAVLGKDFDTPTDFYGGKTPRAVVASALQAQSTARAEKRRTNLLEKPHVLDPETGQIGVQTPQGDLIPTERTGTQEGQRKMAEYTAFEGSPAYVATKADVENRLAQLTRGDRARTAQAEAQAREQGTTNVRLAPQTIAGEANRARAIAEATAQGTMGTQSERAAVASITPMLLASSKAMEMERDPTKSKTAYITPTSRWRAASPLGSFISSKMENIPLVGGMFEVEPGSKAYTQFGVEWAMHLGKVMSGVTVRPDEMDAFLTSYFRVDGDSDEIARQKMQSRNTLMAAAASGAGRRKGDIGKVLGQALLDGSLSEAAFKALTLDPEVRASVAATLNPAAMGTR